MNLSDFFADEIAPLLESVHLRVSGAESRGHAKWFFIDSSSLIPPRAFEAID